MGTGVPKKGEMVDREKHFLEGAAFCIRHSPLRPENTWYVLSVGRIRLNDCDATRGTGEEYYAQG